MLRIAMQAGESSIYYTYVLKSKADSDIYIGWTKNIENRIIDHNSGKVEATAHRRPLHLIYFEACLSEKKAIAREKQLKTGFGRAYLKRRLK